MQIKAKLTAAACVLLTMTALVACSPGTATNNTTNGTSTGTANNTTSTALPGPATYSGSVVATYNGGDVKKDELDKLYNLLIVVPGYQSQESKKDFLTYYVVWYKYIYGQASQDKSFKVDPAAANQMADKSISDLVGTGSYKTQDDVLKAMQKYGVSRDDLVRMAVKGQYIRNYVQGHMKGLTVSDTAITDFYNKNQSQFMTVTVDHILLKTEADAKKVEGLLKGGADFAKTADKYSTDPGVKDNHGTYANTPLSAFDPDFAKAAATLPLNSISDPVHTQFGYHIMRVEKRSVQPLAQVKSTIQQQLLQQLQSQKEQDLYNAATKAANLKLTVKEADL